MRLPDWNQRMWDALKAADERPFFYGACVQLCAEIVDAMTGSCWTGSVRPLYESETDARRLIESRGLEALITERLGAPVPRNLGRQGDVMLLEIPLFGPAAGISVGDRIAGASERGVIYIPFARGLKAWRID